MKSLTPTQIKRAVELLDEIVKPGEVEFWKAIQEAQELLGYNTRKSVRNGRSFYGVRKPLSVSSK